MGGKEIGSSYVGLFFSGVAGIAGILAALSPLFGIDGVINNLFIDKSVVPLASLVSLIVLILTIWFFNSLDSFLVFGSDFKVIGKMRFRSIIIFIIICALFYSTKLFFDAGQIHSILARIGQMIFYISAFFTLGIAVGLTIVSSLQSIRSDNINQTRIDRIIQVLVKSNIVPFNIKILEILQDFKSSHVPGLEWTYIVKFEIKINEEIKIYLARFHGDFTRMIAVQEYNPDLPVVNDNITN